MSIQCILYFIRSDLDSRHSLDIKFPLDVSVLQPGKSVSKINSENSRLFTPLESGELPGKEHPVIIRTVILKPYESHSEIIL